MQGPVARSDACPTGIQEVGGFNPPVRQHSFVEIGDGIISMATLSLPLLQVGQLSVTREKICTKYG